MEEEDVLRAKRLLQIADIIDVYGYYLFRRGIGSFYIGISATVSVGLFIILTFIELPLLPYQLAIGYILFGIFIYAMIAILVKQLLIVPSIYLTTQRYERKSRKSYYAYVWIPLSIIYVSAMVLANINILPKYLAPIFTEIFVGLGQIGNYWASSKLPRYPGKISTEYLIFGIIILLGTPLIGMFPGYEWFIVTVFCIIGSYLFGVYLIITAGRILKKREK